MIRTLIVLETLYAEKTTVNQIFTTGVPGTRGRERMAGLPTAVQVYALSILFMHFPYKANVGNVIEVLDLV